MNIRGFVSEIRTWLGKEEEEARIPVELYLNESSLAVLLDLPDKNASIRLEVIDNKVNLEYKITREGDGDKLSRTRITLYDFGKEGG